MAGDLFCWPYACVFVLCEHMAFVLVFCVPCALMSIILTPPILLPDYWLICPTCVFLVTLLICSLYNLLVFAVLCQFVIACILSCPVCLGVPCPALPSLPSLPAVLFFPYGVVFVACFVLFLINKTHSPALLSPRLIPLPNPDSTNWPKEDSAGAMGIFLFPSPCPSTHQMTAQRRRLLSLRQGGASV